MSDELSITTVDKFGKGRKFFVNRLADVCPHCHHAMTGAPVFALYVEQGRETRVEAVHVCQTNSCQKLFIGYYDCASDDYSEMQWLIFSHTGPPTISPPTIRKAIADISRDYVDIYSQAYIVEGWGLKLIAGVGYRKALEFLIKDYVGVLHPDKVESIRASNLSVCIKNWVDDGRVRKCAERAVWLGNDETHYLRKWADKDITDLKSLLKLTENWIESSILTEDYEKDMPQGKM